VPCDSCGARELKDYLHQRLGAPGHVSADGNFSWLEVECLGACCNAPMAQINQDYYEDLTPELLGKLMDDLAAGRPVKIGSQVGRTSSEPQGGADTLTDATLFDGSRVGAWRKRFETADAGQDEAAGKAEAASSEQRAAVDPKPARPDAGRAVGTASTDAPAQRAAAGEAPVSAGAKADAADTTESTAQPNKPAAPDVIAKAEAAGAEAGTQSDLPRNEPPPQPAASGASGDAAAASAPKSPSAPNKGN
jgi:NADH-quinone oxidoreductase subunit E